MSETKYEPFVKAVLNDLPEVACTVLDNNPRLYIEFHDDHGKVRVSLGEMIGDNNPKWRGSIGYVNLRGLSAVDALTEEAKSFGKLAGNLTLIHNGKIIQSGEPLGKKLSRTPYEIKLEAPSHFQIRNNYGASGGEGFIDLYGLNLNEATGFNAGNQSERICAYSIGNHLNIGESRVINEFIPYAGNKDYFVQGQWRSTDLAFKMGINVESVAWAMRRNPDKTLEVIILSETFKKIITPEIIQKAIRDLKK